MRNVLTCALELHTYVRNTRTCALKTYVRTCERTRVRTYVRTCVRTCVRTYYDGRKTNLTYVRTFSYVRS